MKPQWDEQIAQFSTAMDIWRSTYPKLPPAFSTSQGVSVQTEDLGKALEETGAALSRVNDSVDIDPLLLSIHQQGILSAIGQVASLSNNLQANPSPQFLDQLAQQTWTIRASIVWLMPWMESGGNIAQMIIDLDLNSKIDALQNLSSQLSQELAKSKESSKEISDKEAQVIVLAEAIKVYEKEASSAKANSEASAASAASSKESLATQLGELTAGIQKYTQLLTDIDVLREKATSTLESTSKVALAASFSDRKTELEGEKVYWKRAFAGGITILFAVGLGSTVGVFMLPAILVDGKIEVGPLLTRFALIGPFIWFTWFSARQYGTTARLIEDYAFKEASALAFVGYQREMGGDSAMIQLLRESAINNFGSRPTKVFEKPDPTSPMHELLDKALEKGATEKFLDLVKALIPGKS